MIVGKTELSWGICSSITCRKDPASMRANFPFLLVYLNGNPLQCSCLENPRDGVPGGLPSMGSHRVGHDWSDLAAAAHASNVMPKILQASLQQYVNKELPYVQAGFRKGRGNRDQVANIRWIIERARVPEKHLLLLYWLDKSLWLCGSQQTMEYSSRDGNTRPPDLPPEKPVYRSRNNS